MKFKVKAEFIKIKPKEHSVIVAWIVDNKEIYAKEFFLNKGDEIKVDTDIHIEALDG